LNLTAWNREQENLWQGKLSRGANGSWTSTDKRLRQAGVCQDRHWDFSRPHARLPWDNTLASGGHASPCGWWQKHIFSAVGLVWPSPSSRGRTAETKSPVSWSLAFVLSQRGLFSLICVNKPLQWRVQFI